MLGASISKAQLNWVSQTSGTTQYVRAFDFLTDAEGIAVCDDGLILKTTDYGNNWVQVFDVAEESGYSLSDNMRDVYYKDANNIMVFAHFGKILTSPDGGTNWNEIYNGPDGDNIYDAAISGDRILVSRVGNVLYTDDFGLNWDSSSTPGVFGSVLGIDFEPNGNFGIACGVSAGLSKSTDNGNTWQAITGIPTTHDLNDVYVFNASKCIVVGDSGTVLLSNNAGASWNNVTMPTTYDHIYAIDFSDANHGVIAGQDGAVFETSDGGLNWIASPNTGLTTYLAVHLRNSYRGWLGGLNGVILGSPSNYYTVDIVEYLGPDTTCYNTPFDFSFKFINQGPGEMINPPFSVIIGTEDLFGGQIFYPGIVPPGDSAVFTISAVQDAVNGTGNQPITIYAVIPPTFVGYFVNEDTIHFTDEVPYSITGDTLFCPGDSVKLIATGGTSYIWSSNSSQALDDPGSSTQQLIPTGDTEFYIEIIQQYCKILDTVMIYQDLYCDTTDTTIVINPSESYAFSPNGDGVNDTFVIDFLNDSISNNVSIYNRWGDEVATFANYNNSDVVWNGSSFWFGEVPSGTYYFIVETFEPNAKYRGWVQVVK